MKIFLTLLLTFSFPTLAKKEKPLFKFVNDFNFNKLGGWASGGGNAVVCFEKTIAKKAVADVKENDGIISDNYIPYIDSIEMYDLYEASLPRGLSQTKPEFIGIARDESLTSYTERIRKRFNDYVPAIGMTIQSGIQALPNSNIRFFEGAVTQLNDINNVIGEIDQDSCVISTMAIQRNVNNYFTLFIDSRLFNHPTHSKQSKATLLLHEYIYTQARLKGQKSSAETRELVGLAITRHPDYTVDFLSFMVENLNFNYESVDLGDLYRKHIIHSAAIHYMSSLFALGYKNIAKLFMEYPCMHSCNNLKKEFNKLYHPLSLPEELSLIQLVFFIQWTYDWPQGSTPEIIRELVGKSLLEIKTVVDLEIDSLKRSIEASIVDFKIDELDKESLRYVLKETTDDLKKNVLTILHQPNGTWYLLETIHRQTMVETINQTLKLWVKDKELNIGLGLQNKVP